MRVVRAREAASLTWFSRDTMMFCRSSSESAFWFSRYSASIRSLACTTFCCFATSSVSHCSVLSVFESRNSRFSLTYSSATTLTARAANWGSAETKYTSTRRLPRTGTTWMRPRNASACWFSVACWTGPGRAASGLPRNGAVTFAFIRLMTCVRNGGVAPCPLNSGTVSSFKRLTARSARSRP